MTAEVLASGAPAERIGHHVWLHLMDGKVVITHAGKAIAQHPLRAWILAVSRIAEPLLLRDTVWEEQESGALVRSRALMHLARRHRRAGRVRGGGEGARMIELPEVVTLARQMNEALNGKRVASANRGNSPHKWVFYNRPPEEFAKIPVGKTVGEVRGEAKWIFAPLEPGFVLLIGETGGRVLFHQDERTIPQRYHLLLGFEDGTCLTVAVQGWGSILLVTKAELAGHPAARGTSPLSDAFTYEWFKRLLQEYEGRDKKSVKELIISGPGISGIGNGYLQDILFRARVHPTRKVAEITGRECRRLYDATRRTMKEAVRLDGRDTERDLYGNPGRYRAVLDKRAKGKPCRECGTAIEKIAFLGGAAYFCPGCQM